MSINSAPAAIVRRAQPGDTSAICGLLAELGYPSSEEQVQRRSAESSASDATVVLVAESQGKLAGLVTLHCIPLFHADGFMGKITSLVVGEKHRGSGVGRLLVAAAENFAWERGCIRIEVVSGDHRPDAHAFYERIGYQLESRRFVKAKR